MDGAIVASVFYLKQINLHVVNSFLGRWTCSFVFYFWGECTFLPVPADCPAPALLLSVALSKESPMSRLSPLSLRSLLRCTLEQTPARETLLGNPGAPAEYTDVGEIVACLHQLCSEQQSLCNCRLQFIFLQWELQSTGLLSGRPLDKCGRSFLWLAELMRHILRLGCRGCEWSNRYFQVTWSTFKRSFNKDASFFPIHL